MDWTMDPGSRLRRLPAVLRYPALLLRNLGIRPRRARYVYENDGLATIYFSPFLSDEEWSRLYDEMAADWYVAYRADVRWRMWVLTSLARQCQPLSGNFVEFGVYRGGCAFMILATTPAREDRTLYLFDTFTGIPRVGLTEEEESWGITGKLADTSVEHVERLLARWERRFVVIPGDVFDTLENTETGPIAFAHVDLNHGAATLRSVEYLYSRLTRGGVALFDDYGASGGGPQRKVIDAFFAERSEEVIAMPTGQAFVVKH